MAAGILIPCEGTLVNRDRIQGQLQRDEKLLFPALKAAVKESFPLELVREDLLPGW